MSLARRTLQRSLLACLIGAALASPVSAFTELDSKFERNFDARSLVETPPLRAAIGAQADALAALQSRVPELAFEIDGAKRGTEVEQLQSAVEPVHDGTSSTVSTVVPMAESATTRIEPLVSIVPVSIHLVVAISAP